MGPPRRTTNPPATAGGSDKHKKELRYNSSMATTTMNPAFAIEREEGIPWYLWAGLIATTSAVIGGQWDISWHRSIGRDTVWTPAHMAIYLCGIIAGFGGGAVTLMRTFGPREASRE